MCIKNLIKQGFRGILVGPFLHTIKKWIAIEYIIFDF